MTEDVKEHYLRTAANRNSVLQPHARTVFRENFELRKAVIERMLMPRAPFECGLDIGTGTGVWIEVLAKYCKKVLGIDFVEKNLEYAQNNARSAGLSEKISFCLDDAQNLSSIKTNSQDIAVEISVFQHLPDQKRALRRVWEILRGNGYFIVLVHNSECFYNRSLNAAKHSDNMISICSYSSVDGLRTMLQETGFFVEETRYVWLFINDFFNFVNRQPFLRPLSILLSSVSQLIEKHINKYDFFSFLFREIVIVAKKRRTDDGNQARS